MGRIVNSTYMSLDGVIEHMEKWHFDYIDDAPMKYAWELLRDSEALIMGRLTYEGFAESWAGRDGEFADKINSMPKYVASSTLESADRSGSTLIEGDLVDGVRRIKEQTGGDILQYGFGSVSETLLQNGLLDELQLWVHPVLAGVGDQGDMLFRGGNAAKLELAGTKQFDNGVIVLSYRPA